MTDDNPTDRRPETRVAQAGVGADPAHGAIAPPIYLSSTFRWDDPDHKPAYDYGRSRTPTRGVLEDLLADLEGGAGAVVTATGMAAVDLPLNLVKRGGLVVAPHDCYGGTYRLLAARAARGDFEILFVDQTDETAFVEALSRRPALVYMETPSNPLMRITDLARWAAAAREAGALSVVDNTFLSPVLQTPLKLGCDLVVHSTTKAINGHTDVIGGALVAWDKALADELGWWANCTGVTGAAFDSFLTLRGIRSLFVRMEKAQETAGALAEWLAAHEAVEAVYYPGLADHPGHDIAARQQAGFGAMLSAEFVPEVDGAVFLRALRIFNPAASLGGFESLLCLPALMTHAGMPREERLKAGLTDTLVRYSVGLEALEDLREDLAQAIDAARG